MRHVFLQLNFTKTHKLSENSYSWRYNFNRLHGFVFVLCSAVTWKWKHNSWTEPNKGLWRGNSYTFKLQTSEEWCGKQQTTKRKRIKYGIIFWGVYVCYYLCNGKLKHIRHTLKNNRWNYEILADAFMLFAIRKFYRNYCWTAAHC